MNAGAFVVSELAHDLFLVALLAHLGGRISNPWGARGGAWLGFAIGAMLSVLPGEWNPAFHTRSLLGEPGALGWLLMLHWLSVSLRGVRLFPVRDLRALAIGAVAGAILIYPASLGVPGWPDFYSADFGGFVLPSAALGFALVCLWRQLPGVAIGVAWGLVLYGFDLHESANLWDCLIDFPSVVVSIIILMKAAIPYGRLRSGRDGASLVST